MAGGRRFRLLRGPEKALVVVVLLQAAGLATLGFVWLGVGSAAVPAAQREACDGRGPGARIPTDEELTRMAVFLFFSLLAVGGTALVTVVPAIEDESEAEVLLIAAANGVVLLVDFLCFVVQGSRDVGAQSSAEVFRMSTYTLCAAFYPSAGCAEDAYCPEDEGSANSKGRSLLMLRLFLELFLCSAMAALAVYVVRQFGWRSFAKVA